MIVPTWLPPAPSPVLLPAPSHGTEEAPSLKGWAALLLLSICSSADSCKDSPAIQKNPGTPLDTRGYWALDGTQQEPEVFQSRGTLGCGDESQLLHESPQAKPFLLPSANSSSSSSSAAQFNSRALPASSSCCSRVRSEHLNRAEEEEKLRVPQRAQTHPCSAKSLPCTRR